MGSRKKKERNQKIDFGRGTQPIGSTTRRILRLRNVTAVLSNGYLRSPGDGMKPSFYKEITYEQGSERVLSSTR